MTEKEEKYRLACQQEIESLLRGKFMQIDPNEEDDANLIIETDIRSRVSTFEGISFCSHVNQFCSLLSIDGVDTEVWEQLPSGEVYVEGLSMHPYNYKGKEKVWAPFNQFQYPMVLDKGLGIPFQESDAVIASSVDGKLEEEYIKTREGHMFFYSYYIGGVTKFNQSRPCFRLYSLKPEILPDLLRREIVKAQAIAIQYIYRYPEFCRPTVPLLHIDYNTERSIMKEVSREYIPEILELSDAIKHRVDVGSIKVEHI